MAKEMETIVKMSGSIDPSLKKAIDHVADNIDQIAEAAEHAAGPVAALSGVIDKQADALKRAQLKYANYVLAGEEGSQAAQELAKEITDLSRDLQENQSALSNAERAAASLADGFEDAEDGASDLDDAAAGSGDGFTIMKGAIADLISNGVQWLIGKLGEAVDWLGSLPEETQEYREDIGKLETAWQSAGKSTELATDTYKNFYSVLGEEDRSVEAVNHLAKFVDTEKDMQRWTDICTGVWGTFGDSLPIEGLTEASNETAKVGKVTGPLADALNWAGVNEDKFNESLAACSDESERATLITDTLSQLYDEAAGNYEKNNKSIIDARKATSDFTDAQAALGEKLEPITTAITWLKTKALEAVSPVIGKVADGFLEFGTSVLPVVISVLQTMRPIFSTIFSVVSQVASLIARILGTVLPPVVTYIQNNVLPVLTMVSGVIKNVVAMAIQQLTPIINNIKLVVGGIISFIQNVFTGNWAAAWESVKNIFSAAFNALASIAKAPINAVISLVNKAISGINSIGLDIPDWVPLLGGKKFSIDIPEIPMLKAGGFTEGISIAGEEATEAVISFDPAYRSQNLSYWSQAGRILGATADDEGFSLSDSGSNVEISLGDIIFSPQITAPGADKESIIAAIRAEYPEFIDLIDEMIYERMEFAYVG